MYTAVALHTRAMLLNGYLAAECPKGRGAHDYEVHRDTVRGSTVLYYLFFAYFMPEEGERRGSALFPQFYRFNDEKTGARCYWVF